MTESFADLEHIKSIRSTMLSPNLAGRTLQYNQVYRGDATRLALRKVVGHTHMRNTSFFKNLTIAGVAFLEIEVFC